MTTFLAIYAGCGLLLAAIHIYQKRIYRHLDMDFWVDLIMTMLIWPLVLVRVSPDYFRSKEESERLILLKDLDMLPKREWLKHRLTEQEVQALDRSLSEDGGNYYAVGWLDFMSKPLPGDEFWDFTTPPMGHHIWHGYAFVRKGQPVHGIWRVREHLAMEENASPDPHQTSW